jgi:hypothetical protein
MELNRPRCEHFLSKVLDADDAKSLWKKRCPTHGKPSGKSKVELISNIVAKASCTDIANAQEITVDKIRYARIDCTVFPHLLSPLLIPSILQ